MSTCCGFMFKVLFTFLLVPEEHCDLLLWHTLDIVSLIYQTNNSANDYQNFQQIAFWKRYTMWIKLSSRKVINPGTLLSISHSANFQFHLTACTVTRHINIFYHAMQVIYLLNLNPWEIMNMATNSVLFHIIWWSLSSGIFIIWLTKANYQRPDKN